MIVWSNRAALVHRIASAVQHIPDRRPGRASFALIGHGPPAMQVAGERAGLTLDEMFAIFPPLGLRLRRVGGPLAALIGSSFIAVFRKRAGP